MNDDISKEEIKKAKNEYFRAWRKNNRDKVKKAQERYWEKVAKKNKETHKCKYH